jgi:hypothetical protein
MGRTVFFIVFSRGYHFLPAMSKGKARRLPGAGGAGKFHVRVPVIFSWQELFFLCMLIYFLLPCRIYVFSALDSG